MTWSDVVNHKQFFHWRITDNQKELLITFFPDALCNYPAREKCGNFLNKLDGGGVIGESDSKDGGGCWLLEEGEE